ncbi:VlhA.5.01 variable lipoprotein family domain protein [Mycoplasmoides gallisepticum str. R(low)]|uniref:VlhA.5.01 variable lipoprotein family domain protein n=2 Tax=Mycoplasmoides gallisepticum TaxID=2096 RepID=D3DEJ3_MYCGA|nr:hypothetical protein [Mycoplasmoides gallisepticum]ADB96874.1 VlhA.5.01 variable lipoprotein family domain protein [Mycoplasmoides gallisepticum str. R(low)]ADC30536.1 VlhA.5.01 variable lipoprotein family domain protein [Mycoplasmoides gallisepticum str. R(high)]WVH36990.1 hypothetical protein SE856_01975 [Mycoplasmoides gallisepticum]SYV94438.1 VlhA.5.01 variable lipoprotein family domain protein [Mycoplasmoides gallisepticum]
MEFLRQFDTGRENGTDDTNKQSVSNANLSFSHKTLHLTESFNRIVVTGASNGDDTPFFGNVTFTYMPPAATENPAGQEANQNQPSA